jgi:30S ribosomal protein S31
VGAFAPQKQDAGCILLFIWPLWAYICRSKKIITMGRGDKKTKRGKIFKGSFGKSRVARPTQTKKTVPAVKAEA